MLAIGLLPFLAALPDIATGALDGITGVVKAGKRLLAAWRATEPLPPGAPTMKELEHQREQMRSATSHGVVQGPALPSNEAVPNGRTSSASDQTVPKG